MSHTSPKYRLDAAELLREYRANEVAADQKYQGKVVRIKGVVKNTGKDIADKIYVSLYSDSLLFSVQCYFANKQAGKVATLKNGDRVELVGEVKGKMGNVLVKGCRIQ